MSRLLHHIAAGNASPQLTAALQSVLHGRAADFSQGLSLHDARQTIQLLEADRQQDVQAQAEAQGQAQGQSVVQALALQLLTAWAEAGQRQKAKLCSLGVAPVLGQLAMQAVALGDSGRELQGSVCRWVGRGCLRLRVLRCLVGLPVSLEQVQLVEHASPARFAQAGLTHAAERSSTAWQTPTADLGGSEQHLYGHLLVRSSTT